MQASNTNVPAAKATTRSEASAKTLSNSAANQPPPSPPKSPTGPNDPNLSSPTVAPATKPPSPKPNPPVQAVILSPPTPPPKDSIHLSSDEEEALEETDKEGGLVPQDFSDIEVESNGDFGFVCSHFSGTYPVPTSNIANLFATVPQAVQIQQVEGIININPTNKPILSLGDFSNIFQPFLMAIPGNTRKVRVIYSVSNADEHTVFHNSAIINDIVALHGEYSPGAKFPTPLILPKGFILGRVTKIPEGAQFSAKRTDPNNSKVTWFKPSQIQAGMQIPTIIPIPSFLVYDAISRDIDAIVLYERWMSMRDQLDSAYPHTDLLLRSFLKAQTVSSNKKFPQSQVDISIFMENPPPEADEWVTQAVKLLFPMTSNESNSHIHTASNSNSPINTNQLQLHEFNLPPPLPNTTNLNPTSTAPTSIINTTHNNIPTTPSQSTLNINAIPRQRIHTPSIPKHNLIPSVPTTMHLSQPPTVAQSKPTPPPVPEALPLSTLPALPPGFTMEHMAALMATSIRAAQQGVNPYQPSSSLPSVSGTPEFLNTCEDTHKRLIVMCGLPADTPLSAIPYIWHRIARNKETQAKKGAAKSELRENVLHNDAKVVPIAPLLVMIIKREFEEEISGSCRKTAAKGLTIFAVPTMTQAAVNRINDHFTAVETATTTTVKDVTSSSFEAVAPQNYNELIKVTKRFSNLNFALFGNLCPLLVELEKIIEELQEYSEQAISSMTVRTIVSIAWIIHLQSRHFTQGKMVPPTTLIPEFENMKIQISTKQQVYHGDVPTEMYRTNPLPIPTPAVAHAGTVVPKRKINTETARPNVYKKPKLFHIQHYHPKIKESMKVFSSHQKLPRIKAMCEVCNIRQEDIFPKRKDLCIKSALFGTCFDSCTFKHEAVSDEEARKAIETLKHVINNPDKVKNTN